MDAIYALLPSDIGDVYKFSTPDNHRADKFTVINTLGVPADPIQTVIINVNCYTNDLNKFKGIPDLSTLDTMALSTINILHDYNNDEFDIEFELMNIIREENINMHFINLRFRLIFLNN